MALAAALIAVCLASLASAAGASAFGGVDRSFGDDGTVALSFEPAPQHPSYASDLGVSPDGTIYVLNTANSACTPTLCSWVYFLIRLNPNGSRDWTYGGDGTVELPADGAKVALGVDPQGRQLVAIYNSALVELLRLRPNGTPDTSFGKGGTARFSCACTEATVELSRDRGHYMYLVQRSTSYSTSDSEITVRRLTAKGRIAPRYGNGSAASTWVSDSRDPGPATVLDGGGLAFLVGAGWESSGFAIAKVGSRGHFDGRFADRTAEAVNAWMEQKRHYYWTAGALVARSGGRFDVVGVLDSSGFVLRLRSDGSIDRRFGSGGVKWLDWRVEAAVAGPGGRVFTVGRRNEGFSTVAGWLDRKGNPIASFAGGHGAPVPPFNTPEPIVALQRGKKALLLETGFLECRSGYCPPKPFLTRVTGWAPG